MVTEYGGARYRQVLCANSFTSLAELSLHRAGKPALNNLVAEDRERVKDGETVLKDVSFTAKQGQVTALVGSSGGGKAR